jgi:hypothetical protein
MKATIMDSNTLAVETKQSVGGSGARNMIVWALKAYNLGYKHLQVYAPNADIHAHESLLKAERDANELLNPHGMSIETISKKLEV